VIVAIELPFDPQILSQATSKFRARKPKQTNLFSRGTGDNLSGDGPMVNLGKAVGICAAQPSTSVDKAPGKRRHEARQRELQDVEMFAFTEHCRRAVRWCPNSAGRLACDANAAGHSTSAAVNPWRDLFTSLHREAGGIALNE